MIRHSSSHLKTSDFDYVSRVARTNFVGEGPLVARFRECLSSRFGRSGTLLTNSGTAALEIALHQLRKAWSQRRHVVVSSYVCPAVVNAIERERLKPVFVDVQARSLNLDVVLASERMDERTLAIICTHLAGMPDNCLAAERFGVPVISDCAQAIGARLDGREITQYGCLAVLSFGSTKPFTAGTGGALMTNDQELLLGASTYACSELPVEHYQEYGFEPTCGQNFSDLNAGLGIAQLKRFEALLKRRRSIAEKYDAELEDSTCLVVQDHDLKSERNGYRYYFLSDNSSKWLVHLRGYGIDARPSIAHDMSSYYRGAGRLPNVRRHASRVVSVPIHPAMSTTDVQKVALALRRGLEAGLQ